MSEPATTKTEESAPSPARWTSTAGIVEVTDPNGRILQMNVGGFSLQSNFSQNVNGKRSPYSHTMPSDPQPAPGENLLFLHEDGHAPKLKETQTILAGNPYEIETQKPLQRNGEEKKEETNTISFNRPPTQKMIDSIPLPEKVKSIHFNLSEPEIGGNGFLKKDGNGVRSQVPLVVSPGLDFSRFTNLESLQNYLNEDRYNYTDGSFDLSGFANCKNLKAIHLHNIPATAFQGNELLANHSDSKIIKMNMDGIAEGKVAASHNATAPSPTPTPAAPAMPAPAPTPAPVEAAKKTAPTAAEQRYLDVIGKVLPDMTTKDDAAQIMDGLKKVFAQSDGDDDVAPGSQLEAQLQKLKILKPSEFNEAMKGK